MKPDITIAMRQLIDRIRQEIPLDLPAASVCADECNGCSLKLLEYLRSEVDNWEYRLDQGERPNFKDLNQLARSARRIHKTLVKNRLLADDGRGEPQTKSV